MDEIYVVGDIISKSSLLGKEVYIVTGIRFEYKTTNVDYYEALRLTPISEDIPAKGIFIEDIDEYKYEFHVTDAIGEEFIKALNLTRTRRGYEEIARFLSERKADIVKGEVKKETPPKEKEDFVKYHRIESIDECLEAIYHLNELHNVFKDEAYIQLKKVVYERIKELMKLDVGAKEKKRKKG